METQLAEAAPLDSVIHLPSVHIRQKFIARPRRKPFSHSLPNELIEFRLPLQVPVVQARRQASELPRLPRQLASSCTERLASQAVVPKKLTLDVAEEEPSSIVTLLQMKKYRQLKGLCFASKPDCEGYRINEYSLPNALVAYRPSGKRPRRSVRPPKPVSALLHAW